MLFGSHWRVKERKASLPVRQPRGCRPLTVLIGDKGKAAGNPWPTVAVWAAGSGGARYLSGTNLGARNDTAL